MTDPIFGPGTLLGPEPVMLIGGQRVTAAETRPVENPATGEQLAAVPEATPARWGWLVLAQARWAAAAASSASAT